jgi:hypothetical protein
MSPACLSLLSRLSARAHSMVPSLATRPNAVHGTQINLPVIHVAYGSTILF